MPVSKHPITKLHPGSILFLFLILSGLACLMPPGAFPFPHLLGWSLHITCFWTPWSVEGIALPFYPAVSLSRPYHGCASAAPSGGSRFLGEVEKDREAGLDSSRAQKVQVP